MANEHFYPEIEPYPEGRLRVDGLHTLYREECGTPDGLPILFIHGGPGAGCSTTDRRFFDPHRFRIIPFHQRGCGRSKPAGELKDNTPTHLVADIEKLREELARVGCYNRSRCRPLLSRTGNHPGTGGCHG